MTLMGNEYSLHELKDITLSAIMKLENIPL